MAVRGNLVSSLIFIGGGSAGVVVAISGDPYAWAPALTALAVGFLDARRVWKALHEWEQLRGRLR